MPKEETLSLLETMGETGLSSTYLYLLLRARKLCGEKDSNGRWRIFRSEVEALKKKREAKSAQ